MFGMIQQLFIWFQPDLAGTARRLTGLRLLAAWFTVPNRSIGSALSL